MQVFRYIFKSLSEEYVTDMKKVHTGEGQVFSLCTCFFVCPSPYCGLALSMGVKENQIFIFIDQRQSPRDGDSSHCDLDSSRIESLF